MEWPHNEKITYQNYAINSKDTIFNEGIEDMFFGKATKREFDKGYTSSTFGVHPANVANSKKEKVFKV